MVSSQAKCGKCGADYSGRTRDDLCPVCLGRDRRRIYADPTDATDLVLRELGRAMVINMVNEAVGPGAGQPFPNGICGICGKALDDHRLMYSDKKYALGLCKTAK